MALSVSYNGLFVNQRAQENWEQIFAFP